MAEDGRKCQTKSGLKQLQTAGESKFTSQELPGDGAFITGQIETNKVVYSILLTKAKNPLSREEVESHFEAELAKSSNS